MKIFLDVDGVICNFSGGLENKYPQFKIKEQVEYALPSYVDMATLYSDKAFWLGLGVIDRPTVEIAGLVSHRPFETYITEFWLHINRFPRIPVYHVDCSTKKAELLLSLGVDLYIDDKAETVIHCASAGINAYCYTQPWNETFTGLKRITCLTELERLCNEY